MSSPQPKKRSSILKKRVSNFESPEATATSTKLPRRGILFSQKNSVKEFLQCDEKTTIWGNSYETSIAKSDGSSDGSCTSKKLSFDFSSSNIQVSAVATETFEAEKENIIVVEQKLDVEEVREEVKFVVPPAPEPNPQPINEIRKTLSPISTSISNSGLSLENITVEIHADEKKRIKKYGIDNLNITNMQLDTTLNKKNEEKMIQSPRKTILFQEEANMSVSPRENVLVKPEESAKNSAVLSFTKDLSLNLENDETSFVKSTRKTILKPNDMDVSLGQKQHASNQNKNEQIFKLPSVPKVFNFNSSVADNSNMDVDSSPIKPLNLGNDKQVLEEFMEFLVTDTPTKNLCHQMCSSKKHSITPLRMPPSKIVFSSTKTSWKKRTKSTEILEALGLDLTDKMINISKKETESVDCEQTNLKQDISTASKVGARKSLFDEDTPPLSKPLSVNQEKAKENTFFDLEDDTIAATKSMTLVKLKDIEKPVEKRKTVFSDEISFTCNFSDFNSLKSANSSYNRTNANETGISETTIELAAKAARLLKDPMATTASTSNLFTRTFQQEADMKLNDSLAKTIRDESLNMSAEYFQQISNGKSPSGARGTVYDHSSLIASDVDEQTQNNQFNLVNRYSIDISGIEPTVEIPKSNGITIYEDSIKDETDHSPSFRKPMQKTNTRKTILDSNTSMVTENEPILQNKNSNKPTNFIKAEVWLNTDSVQPKSSRDSTFVNNSMDRSVSIQEKISTNIQPTKSRCTFYINDSIIETNSIAPSDFVREPVKITLNNESLDDLLESEVTQKEGKRFTIYEEQSMVEGLDISQKSTLDLPAFESRKTCYENLMEETCNNLDVSKAREASVNYSETQFKKTQQFLVVDPKSSFNLSNESDKIPLVRRNSSNQCQFESMCIEEPAEVSEPDIDISVHENTQAMFRESVIVKAPAKVLTQQQGNCPSIKDVATQLEESLNSTYTNVKQRDENIKLLNITSAEIVSMIDDETSPILNDSDHSYVQPLQVSFGNNLSNYQQALEDYVNITIVNSPLNISKFDKVPPVKDQFIIHEIPKRIDYNAKLNELMVKLEKKEDEVKPKLAIDEFLEKLNIKQIKIPRLPQLEPGYLMKMYQKTKDRLEREKVEKKAALTMQLPEIPDYGFLIDNKLKWMDQEIQAELERKRRESLIALTPVFPERRDFDFLLENKFETDEQLSKIWKLDLTFAWMRQYKFSHKLLPGFKINVTVQKMESLNASTIPIYFEKVLMYTDPKYRGIKSTKTTILMKEFHRSIGTDLFTSMCPSDKELLTFLQHFHEQAKKTASLGENFLAIIGRHSAILEQHREGKRLIISHITKRIFTKDGSDIVDVMINVKGYIEEISIKDVVIKGLTRYVYKLQPRPSIEEKKGLFLIELILFDPEKFMHENTCRCQQE